MQSIKTADGKTIPVKWCGVSMDPEAKLQFSAKMGLLEIIDIFRNPDSFPLSYWFDDVIVNQYPHSKFDGAMHDSNDVDDAVIVAIKQ